MKDFKSNKKDFKDTKDTKDNKDNKDTKDSKDTKKEFVERKFEEVEGGHYDEYGFYYTPNGSKHYLF